MPLTKQIVTVFILVCFVIIGVAAISPPIMPHKNLKILPQDISDEKLDSIMHSYNKALNVKCDFCHAKMKNIPDSLDYAADIPEKEDARKMIRLTTYINNTYFNYKNITQPEYLNVVQCMTCHRGDPYPEHPEPILQGK